MMYSWFLHKQNIKYHNIDILNCERLELFLISLFNFTQKVIKEKHIYLCIRFICMCVKS